jgi:3-hydroxyisobutyrate dehydrogenase-like beta-hydroxyacid dehydrogenase
MLAEELYTVCASKHVNFLDVPVSGGQAGEAQRNGSLTPVAELVDSFYAELQQQGEQRSDTSVLIKRLDKKYME